MAKDPMVIWTIYNRPLDYPEKFVARRWLATPQPTPTDEVIVADELDGLRRQLPAGLYRMERQPGDDPFIVECWI
jgi:hypothetical protein